MNLSEYSALDGTALAALVAKGEVTTRELTQLANAAIAIANPKIGAVIEVYDDRIEAPETENGPLKGVPYLVKDNGAYEQGRKREFGSRLCVGMKSHNTSKVIDLVKEAGLNIIGRTNVPEFCIAGTSENALYGNTSTPWRKGYSAGGSSGGSAAAVSAGIVPMAHGSDIGGSIRIPASYCGGVGLKPSRGRISTAPFVDEGGFGMAQNFVQTRTVRDTAAMLDHLGKPQPGDPFAIAQPSSPFAGEVGAKLPALRIAFCNTPLAPTNIDAPVVEATAQIAKLLADMGHHVTEDSPPYEYEEMTKSFLDTWFFGYYRVIEEYANSTGRTIGPDTLEPQTLNIYETSKAMNPYNFLDAQVSFNKFRRGFGDFFTSYDIWLTPTTAKLPEPHGLYNQGITNMNAYEYMDFIDRPIQFCTPYNISGFPAISLPLCMSPEGLPIGIQIGTRNGGEALLLRLASALELALPWHNRSPIHHVSTLSAVAE
jgi:amidase